MVDPMQVYIYTHTHNLIYNYTEMIVKLLIKCQEISELVGA